jgi:hypothetical protein
MLSTKIRTIILGAVTAAAVSAPGVASAALVVRSPGTVAPVRVASPVTSVALEAFPAGGKGSGSEKVCGLHTQLLLRDQEKIQGAKLGGSASELKFSEGMLEADKESALNDGCAVID